MWQSSLITIETAAIPAFIILKFSFGKNNISLIVELISSIVPVQIRKKEKKKKRKKEKKKKREKEKKKKREKEKKRKRKKEKKKKREKEKK